jgi:cilla- and flagella-associated protein
MISNGGSQDRYPDERRDLYQYRNGNVSREDFGEEMSDRRRGDGRRENSVISNAVLNHLAGLHRRPVNRVRTVASLRKSFY